jgi:hypothetical protein
MGEHNIASYASLVYQLNDDSNLVPIAIANRDRQMYQIVPSEIDLQLSEIGIDRCTK